MKIQTYTSIAGDNDHLRDDVLCITGFDKFKRDVYNARIFKILPHLMFPDADVTVWIDGNIYIKPEIDVEAMVNEFLGDNDIVLFKHPGRDCIFQEADACNRLYTGEVAKEVARDIESQMLYYKDFPKHFGLWETGVLIRRNNKKMARFNEKWWSHISMFSNRDQLSFPVVVKESPNIKLGIIPGSIYTHPYLRYVAHKRPRQ